MSAKPKSSFELSGPWLPEQYLLIDGHPLAYLARKSDDPFDWQVLFACGKSATVNRLLSEGRKVRLPSMPRYVA